MDCKHRFIKAESVNGKKIRWYHTHKWVCIFCGLMSRPYDSADRTALRPIHPHMSVVVIGYNTVEENK